jgi:hypothetical protein
MLVFAKIKEVVQLARNVGRKIVLEGLHGEHQQKLSSPDAKHIRQTHADKNGGGEGVRASKYLTDYNH